MQTTLLGLAIALILALLAALVGPFFIDWTQYRPAFERQASRALGLPVKVNGPIDVRLLPSPSLLLSGIEIGANNPRQPLRARALGIELALGSLIRGQMRASELRLVGPDVALGLGQDGRLNVPSLAAGLNLNDVSIGRLHIEDARLSFSDAASGKQAVLDKLWFGGEVRSLGAGVFRGEGAFVFDGGLYGYRVSSARPDDGDARIKLSVEPSEVTLLAESEGALSFPDGTPRFEGSLTLTRPVGTAPVGGKVAIGEPWRAAARVTATPASALFEQLEMQYGPEERALKATGTAEMAFGGQPRIEAVISARQIDVDRALATQDQPRRDPAGVIRSLVAAIPHLSRWPVPLQIGFGIDGVTLGGGALQSLRGDIIAAADGISLKGIEFRAPGFTQIQVSGRLKGGKDPSFAGPVDVSSVDPRVFVAWLEGKTEIPSGATAPLRGRGEVAIDDRKLAVERLAFEVERKPINGRVAYLYPGGDRKARLDVDIKAADADIDAIATLAAAIFKDSKLEKPGEISLALDMDRARFAGLDAQRAQVTASFDAAGLKIDRLSVGDFGGMKVDAKGFIDTASASPRGTMALDLDARDLSGLTALAAKFAPRSLDFVRGLSERAGNASLHAKLDVEAAKPQAAQSRATFDIGGKLGKTQLALRGSMVGTLAEAAKAQLQVGGEWTGDDATALLRVTGLDRFFMADHAAGKMTVSATGQVNGDMRFDGRITGGNLAAAAAGHVRLLAEQGPAGEFDLTVSKADAGALLPSQQSLPVTLTTRAVLSGSSLKLNQISAGIAGVPLRGRLGLMFGPVTGVDGDIETETIDASGLIAAAIGLSPEGQLSSEEPFARGLYAQSNGRISFRAKSADLNETLVMRNVKGAVQLAPSAVTIDIEQADLAAGGLSGEFSARKMPDGTYAKIRLVLKGAEAAHLVPAFRQHLSGRINLNAELDGAGRSPKALIGSLSGAGTLTAANMRVQGLDPKAFADAMRAVDQGLPLDGSRVRDAVMPALDRGVLSIRVAEMPFTVSAGQMRFGTLLAQADGADMAMTGIVDLGERTLESRILLTGADAATAAGRPELSMQIKGPIAAPARHVDVAALTGWLALRAVEQQSKKLDAIERGAPPVTSSVPPVPASPPITLPERLQILPRTRPAAEVRPSQAAPLPPPVNIKPAPGLAPAQGESRPQNRPTPQVLTPLPRESSF